MGIRVVLKQYKRSAFKGIFRELKIFTYLENVKNLNQGAELTEVLQEGSQHDGLPCLLGYKIGENFGEILMTNGGSSLENWQTTISSKTKKMTFVLTMLKQLIPALKTLHSFGYSHGDLKLENVCARPSKGGDIKFTLIDLGMCSKLMKPDSDPSKKYFRGNYIFCHAM